jgi:hypothetical protein
MTVHVLGIRHHGPGSARSVRLALESLAPDIVLVEGPPDAQEVLALAGHASMKPPVALLVYASDAPSDAVFYPFAEFSPEWQAIRFAHERAVPVRFIDLPQANQTSREDAEEKPGGETKEGEATEPAEAPEVKEPFDPIDALAKAAGYEDREAWWEELVERRREPEGVFEAVREAMAAMREGHTLEPHEARREAFMRRCIRAVEREGFQRVAVVCGAWHAPALVEMPPAKHDDTLLKGLPKKKVEATWIPWTYDRLAFRSGYGAGVISPGWYQHLWATPRDVEARWVSRAAQLFRSEGLDASSASVIEAVRLADALAALRGRTAAGLPELTEAIGAVLCHGDATPLALVRTRLEVGVELGEVPEEAPAVPLARDLAASQKTLRLKPTGEQKPLELDLREETDRARSRLLHRLAILAVAWGRPERATGTGTFRERWTLQWRPELAVALVEANVFGNTVEAAATAKVCTRAREATDLPELTALLDATVLAELPAAIDAALVALQARAAVAGDARPLMNAILPLARVSRYGSVRETRADAIAPILDGLFERIVVGVAPACASLDDAAANEMVESIGHVHEAIALLDRAAMREEWGAVMQTLADRDAVHGLVRGAACRYLVEQGALDDDALARRARLALSPAQPSADAAAWAEGLLRGSAQLLLHRDGVWSALDAWLASLSAEAFVELLPLVRRAFGGFDASERRAMGDRAKRLRRDGAAPQAASRGSGDHPLDERRAAQVHAVLSHLIGVEVP